MPVVIAARGAAENSILGGCGGEGGIRTHGTVARTPHFECGTIDHSATSPEFQATRRRTARSIYRKDRVQTRAWMPALRYCDPVIPADFTMSPQRAISATI